jgi:hypothetical protein
MIKVTANCCGKSVTVAEGDAVDVHALADGAGCTCCPQSHHHGQAASETGTPCRPVTVDLLAGSVQLGLEG